MISSEVEAVDRKQKIRDRYKGVDASELEVIPAKTVEGLEESTSIRRVAAYVRVSTDNDEQTSSYELQKNYYTDYIKAQPGWEFVGIYDDEGISGTSLEHRKGMQQLIEDCKAGKIDLILTKSIARFARNIVDCLSVIETLKNLDPPVGVKFEADNIYTLDSNGRMILTILASVAEEESHSKSIIMNWSIDRRFSRGLFLTPALLGYDQDEDGSLVVNQDEAQTVKVIYYLYLNGFSFTEIAELLTEYVQRFFHLHRPPSSVLCLHRHGCNISVPDHTGAGRKTPRRTPGRSSTARSSSSPALDGCCSTVTGIPVSRTSVVCLYGLVRLPYRTEDRRKTPCP